MELIIATRNSDKEREISDILKGLKIKVRSLRDVKGAREVEEDAEDLEGNAIKKALAASKLTGELVMADDSGLEVDALGGLPGVRSSRFAGENVSYSRNNMKLLRLLKGLPKKKRRARFRCCVAIALRGKIVGLVEGVCNGYISDALKGKTGFGYDPLFIVSKYGKTFAQLGVKVKNRISHRSKAVRKAKRFISEFLRRYP